MTDRRAIQIVFVEVPVGGSPVPIRRLPPPAYPANQREHWRPQRAIPTKADATANLLRQIVRQEAAVREMMTPRHPATVTR
jgi:hypothetical protein